MINNGLVSEICRLYKPTLIDAGSEFVDDLCIEGKRHDGRFASSIEGNYFAMWFGPRDVRL